MATHNVNNNPKPGDDDEPFEKAEFMGKQKLPPEDVVRPEEHAGEESEREPGRKEFWAYFGLTPPDNSDMWKQELAPPVNHDLIRRYYDHDLSDAELDYVARMLVRFETWEKTLGRLARERPPAPGSGVDDKVDPIV
jgi:hypothetical protein